TPFSTYVANTVSHELGHTFGLIDAYTSAGDGGAAMCIMGNCIPFDLMRAGSIVDPDLSFLPANTTLLQLALAVQPNDANLTGTVSQYRATFKLPGDTDGIKEIPPVQFESSIAALEREGRLFFSGETDEAGRVGTDGPGGVFADVDYVVHNLGSETLIINSVSLVDGSEGFSVVDTGLIGTPLEPGTTGTLRLRFDPQSSGSFSDILRIESNVDGGFVQEITVHGEGIPAAPTARIFVAKNNLGGVPLEAGVAESTSLAAITNQGAAPLVINSVRLASGQSAFTLIGLPDFGTGPVMLAFGESLTFGARFDPVSLGLDRAVIEVVTNDPSQPNLKLTAVGTGLDSVVYPQWGDDYFAVSTTINGNPIDSRVKSTS